ncbi:ABC transporter permease [Altererythrobacter sp. ZODW24]|uniref:ABC transporter permease n=1 Tax=Altererythrobacter sp. ZODW24 TaxID=2185142 RepID=UPI000DF78CFC|nr:ABC transporter permease [Altererythrobacter sp. ZODW24]
MNTSAQQLEPTGSFINVLISEAAKLRRSLVVLLSVAVPGFVIAVSIVVTSRNGADLNSLGTATAGFWSFAMLPLGITALSVLLAQIEHGSRGWDHMLALPGVAERIFIAKGLIMWLVSGLWGVCLFIGLLFQIELTQFIAPDLFTGVADYSLLAVLLLKMWLASFLLCMILLFVALWFRSFVVPLALGIGGTFAAIATAGSFEGMYFPWLMPLSMLRTDPAEAQVSLGFGLIGGIVLLIIMQLVMQRKRW